MADALTRPAPRTPSGAAPLGLLLPPLCAAGLLLLSVLLAHLSNPPDSGTPWLLAVLALLVVGAVGVRALARGPGMLAARAPAPVTFLLLILAAEALLRAYAVPPGLIPTPLLTVQSLWAARAVLLQDTVYTFVLEALLGFLLGAVTGTLLALLVVRLPFLGRGLLPYAALFSSVPIVALAPVVVKAVGLEWWSKTVVVAITVLFPVVVNVVRGLSSTEPLLLDLMRTYAARPAQVFREVRIPGALPFLFNALKISSTLALISAIVAEFFGTDGHGLGFRIQIEVGRFNLSIVWAAIVLASVAGLLFFWAVSALERALVPEARESGVGSGK